MIELKIILQDDGQLMVGGPIEDKVLCYGLLEAAKDAIRDNIKKSKVLRVPPGAKLVSGG